MVIYILISCMVSIMHTSKALFYVLKPKALITSPILESCAVLKEVVELNNKNFKCLDTMCKRPTSYIKSDSMTPSSLFHSSQDDTTPPSTPQYNMHSTASQLQYDSPPADQSQIPPRPDATPCLMTPCPMLPSCRMTRTHLIITPHLPTCLRTPCLPPRPNTTSSLHK